MKPMGFMIAVCIAVGSAMPGGCGLLSNSAPEAGFLEQIPDQKNEGAASAATSNQQREASMQLTKIANSLTPANMQGSTAYKIGPLDVLEISVFKVPELSKNVQVAESGTINIPLVGEVPVAGRSAKEIEHDLELKLGSKFLRNPQVTVYVKEYNSQRVTVEGAVRKPGIYPIRGRLTLLQVLAMAESPDRDTASNIVAVFRVGDGKRSVARFDIDDIRAGKTEDPVLQQGDVIIVDTSTSKIVFNNFIKMLPTAAAFVPLL